MNDFDNRNRKFERRMFRFSRDERLIERLCDGHRFSIYPQEAKLLELLLQSKGMVLSKERIATEIWGSPLDRAIDKRIRQSAHKLRLILGKDSVITQLGQGLCLSPNAKIEFEMKWVANSSAKRTGRSSLWKDCGLATSASLLFAAGSVIPLFLETAYGFEAFASQIWVASIPIGIFACSSAWIALWLIRFFANGNSIFSGMFIGTSCLIVGVIACVFVAFQVLPPQPVTRTFFPQAQTAQFAYTKNLVFYLLPIFVFFILWPYWTITQNKNDKFGKRHKESGIGNIPKLSIRSLIFVFVAYSTYSTFTSFYLLDNLVGSDNRNLFSFLLLSRNLVYFAIAIAGIWWVYLNQEIPTGQPV